MAYDFDKIATSYDRLNHIMTAGMDRLWRRRAAKEAIKIARWKTASATNALTHSRTNASTLDVACGTGDMAVELLKRGCSVTGIDLSDEMLAIARRKTASANFQLSTFNFQLANAEALPFDDASFDAVTSAFGIRNFVHLDKGLAEMARVLKSGGRMVILEMSTPDSALVRPFYNLYTRRIIPWLGSRIAGNREAYTYLPNSIERFPKGEAMLQKLEAVGLRAEQRKFFFGVCRMYVCEKNELMC